MRSFGEYNKKETEPVSLHESVQPDSVELLIGESQYNLELADTPYKISKGLSGRYKIPQKTGMLFVMPEETRQDFWMRGCLTNMDALFINEDGKIVNMHRMIAETPRHRLESQEQYENRLRLYSSEEPAKYVIEIPAGDITRLGLSIGETVDIDI